MRGKRYAVILMVLALTALAVVPGSTGDTGNNGADDAASDVIPDVVVAGFAGEVPSEFFEWAEAQGWQVLIHDDVLHWVSLRVEAAEATDAIAALSARGDVRFAEHDVLAEIQLFEAGAVVDPVSFSDWEPNDPLYPQQWGYPAIRAPDAWDVQLGSHDVKVAVLDTGIEGDHVDLVDNICGPHNSFVNEPPLEDGHFHGTHVGGTVAAVSDNGIGVAGTSQSCLMDVKVCTRFGSCPVTGVAAGIRWAADNGADIVSMSLGWTSPSQVMEEAVVYAYHEKDVLVVAAAGNRGCSFQDTVMWPAKFPDVVAVAALQSPGSGTAGFSSCGPEIEVSAPGASVLSTSRLGQYRFASGTSMAAPHVSGLAALVLSEHPVLTANQLRCVLARTSDDMLSIGPDVFTGWGRVNAVSAVTLGDVPPTSEATGLPQVNPEQLVYLAMNSCQLEDLLGL